MGQRSVSVPVLGVVGVLPDEELLTFFSFPKVQRKTLRTTNVIERFTGNSDGA